MASNFWSQIVDLKSILQAKIKRTFRLFIRKRNSPKHSPISKEFRGMRAPRFEQNAESRAERRDPSVAPLKDALRFNSIHHRIFCRGLTDLKMFRFSEKLPQKISVHTRLFAKANNTRQLSYQRYGLIKRDHIRFCGYFFRS